jgi:hypothetical protein
VRLANLEQGDAVFGLYFVLDITDRKDELKGINGFSHNERDNIEWWKRKKKFYGVDSMEASMYNPVKGSVLCRCRCLKSKRSRIANGKWKEGWKDIGQLVANVAAW